MVSFFEALILGIVQGITEWLPISSSGHLVLVQQFFGIVQPVVFDVVLHMGSLLAVVLVFWKDIRRLVIGFFRWEKYYVKYAVWLGIATIPIGLVGYFLNDLVKAAFSDVRVVGFSFLFTALVLFLSKFPSRKEKKLSLKSVVYIGLMQSLALLPGVSRSGMTISTGLMNGVKRDEVARFSFLLFIPAIVGAMVLELGSLSQITEVSSLVFATLVTAVVGFISLKWLLKVIKGAKFHYFAWYCLVMGLLVLMI